MSPPSAATSRPALLRLSLECDFEAVRPAALQVRSFLDEQRWPPDDVTACELAVAEACNNAISYAETEDQQKPVELEILSDLSLCKISVTDHTPGFKWPEKIELPGMDSERGRGLFLITTLMDRVRYFQGLGENVLLMQKLRSGSLDNSGSARADNIDSKGKRAADEQIITRMIEELSSCYESLSAIFRYSTELGNPANLKEFARRLLTDLLQIIAADSFVLRLVPRSEARLVVLCASEPLLESEPLDIPASKVPVDEVELEAVLTRQQVWFDEQRPWRPHAPPGRIKPGSHGFVQPIFRGEDLIGTLTVGKSPEQAGEVFTAAQCSVVSTFADFLAIQIVNARFQEDQVSNRLVAHELEIARNIQQSILLKSLPRVSGFDLAAYCESAHQVGGDFYDAIEVSDHALLLVVADVMGKGVPAAMFAAILRTLLRASPELTQQPAALLTRVNRLLHQELSGVDMFITAQLAFVDARERKLVTASAGHCPLLLADAAGDRVQALVPEGMPLGIQPDTHFSDETVALPARGRVLLYTDGVTEALNAKGERYGQEQLTRWLQRSTSVHQTAKELKDGLVEELRRFQFNAAASDDQTFLMMLA